MSRFDLDTAIRTWRHLLAQRRAFLPDDLDELEQHLRDFIRARVLAGLGEEEAFRQGVARIGDSFELEAEYRKVQLTKQKRKYSLWRSLTGEAIMFRNYLTTALRGLRRQAGYAVINLVGLAIGIACFLLVFLYLQHEYSFDTYHEKANRLYRLTSYGGFGGQEKQWSSFVSGDPIQELQTNDPDVEDALKMMKCGSDRLVHEGEAYRDVKMLCAPSNLFNLFSFNLQHGDSATVLDRPNTVVLTASLARRLFGDENPVGKTLPILGFEDTPREMEITGVMADVPKNTHFTFDLLISYVSLESTRRCLDCGQPMYVLLQPGGDPEAVAARVLPLIRDTQGKDYIADIALQPISEIHFSDLQAERKGDRRYVYLLSAIALVILLIACANYTNLATARAIRRTREVGVRKALGAHRTQLMRQFLVETLLVTLLALPLALLLLILALPTFNALANVEIAPQWVDNLPLFGAIVGVLLLVGLVAGSYPALFLSHFRPVEVLRGRLSGKKRGLSLRKTLVVFQFAASIVLLIGTAVILRQLDYVQQKKLGFDAEQMVLVTVSDPGLTQQGPALKQEFLRLAGVTHATAGNAVPGQTSFHGMKFIDQPFGPDGPAVALAMPRIDADFLETMQIPLLAGRNIRDTESPSPPLEALVNEATVAAMQWGSPEEALGKEIKPYAVVVGVVPDFHIASLHEDIEPLMMMQNDWGRSQVIALRLTPGDVRQTLMEIEQVWKNTGTTMPFEFSFLRDELNTLYESEQRTAKIFGAFAGLAVLIACLGLFGLAAFTATQRTKEIGIRKVLGATVANVVTLLAKDFVVLVGVAFVIAAPLAYVAAQRWLEAFAFRTAVSADLFVLAGLAALAVALFSVGLQALRAAATNPTDALRHE